MNGERVSAAVTFGLLLVVAMVLGGWVLGSEIKAVRLSDRYVTVRGLVERQVKSDLAVWPITFQETGDDLTAVTAKMGSDRQTVLDFLAKQGFSAGEVQTGVIDVTDTQAENDSNRKPPHRFILKQTLTLSTPRVDAVLAASQNTLQLLQSGIVLAQAQRYGGEQGVSFLFNGLNTIKPDMITEATRNARAAADRFAADSGSRVGSIRQAEQGVFSISAAGGESADPNAEGGIGSDTSSLMKKVRVVTTVQYYLER